MANKRRRADQIDEIMEIFENNPEMKQIAMDNMGFTTWDEAIAEAERQKLESRIVTGSKEHELILFKNANNIQSIAELNELANNIPWNLPQQE